MESQSSNRVFVENWNIAQTLGEGAYGEVKLLINQNTGEGVAMKIIDLEKHADAKELVKKEVCIHKLLKHPNILKLFGKRTQDTTEFIFLEYAPGGELFDRIEPDVGMEIGVAQRYFKQILSGVEYLHGRGIAHRDLKPENILLDDNDNIKISDFGFATIFRLRGNERLLDKKCGTFAYVAPEVLYRPYFAQPADIWSCGVILVAMLAGELPWDKPTTECDDYKRWVENNYTSLKPWIKLDTLSLSFVRKILVPNPEKRLTLERIQQHKWCQLSQLSTTGSSRDACDGMPNSKRLKSNLDLHNTNLDDSLARMCNSQPAPSFASDDCPQDPANLEARNDYCFSQPAHLSDLLVCSQLNATQSTQLSSNPFQRLVKRMTRFFVKTKCDETIKKLISVLNKFGWTWKLNDDSTVTISTTDRRKLQLIFKANLIDMDGKILLDFRLSKGCGLDFKRNFVKIRESKEIADIINQDIPMNFSLASSVV